MSGIKPKGKVRKDWSPNFAYALGLLATDGCLLNDGRHIDITSKDTEQLKNFLVCLNIKNKITKKTSGKGERLYSRVQFGDVVFYKFLLDIGLMPAKTKILGALKIPDRYFFDFLRGAFDGDGTFFSYYDPRWKSSFMFYTAFASASHSFIDWLRTEIFKKLGIKGHISKNRNSITEQLKYAKKESLKILGRMYHAPNVICLRRKRLKIEKALSIVGLKL